MEPIVEFPDPYAQPISGSFSPYRLINWSSCREIFAKSFAPGDDKLWFAPGLEADSDKNVQGFVNIVEDAVSAGKTSLIRSDAEGVCLVKFPQFWSSCPVKRSLFTILLRLGRYYRISSRNFEDTLYGHFFTRRTKPAIMRFLFGFTEFSGGRNVRHSGWYSLFRDRTDQEVRRMLIAPRKATYSMIDIGTLWSK